MTGGAALLAAAALLVATAPPAGSPRPASVPPVDRAPSGVARQVGAEFADCLWRGNRDRIRRMLDEQVDDDRMPVESLNLGRCSVAPDATVRFPPFVLRGLLFDRMYQADFASSPEIPSFDDRGPAAYPVAPRSVQTRGAKNYRGLMRISDCVVRHAPVQARALLRTGPATHAEERALAAVEPMFRSCQAPLPAQAFSAEMMRGTVAESLYRLSAASAAARGSDGK